MILMVTARGEGHYLHQCEGGKGGVTLGDR